MKRLSVSFLLIAIVITALASASCALHEWFEGYQLEPYWRKSYNPLVKQYANGLILDLVENRAVTKGEEPITGLITYNNREKIETRAVRRAVDNLVNDIGELRLDTNRRLYNLTKNSTVFAEAVRERVEKTAAILHYRIFTMKRVLRVTSAVDYKGPNSLLNVVYPYLIELDKQREIEAEAALATLEAGDRPSGGLFGFLFGKSNTESGSAETSNSVTEEAVASSAEAVDVKGYYTGLIIDARNLNLEPAINPLILDENGEEIFGSISNFDIELLYKRGKVGYFRTLDAAAANYRAGKTPLVVKASSASRNCDPIVSVEDGLKILEEAKSTGFVDKLYVSIII